MVRYVSVNVCGYVGEGKDMAEKTVIYVLQGIYGHGWEDLTAEATFGEAKERRREYLAESVFGRTILALSGGTAMRTYHMRPQNESRVEAG